MATSDTPTNQELLGELRREIDVIDRQLVNLLIERISIARIIGEIKAEEGLPVYDQSREEKVIEQVIANDFEGIISREGWSAIFSEIIHASRRVQEGLTPDPASVVFINSTDDPAHN